MTSHFTGTTRKKKMESWKAASEEVRLQTTAKTGSEGADVACGGRPFQIRAAATGKARSPTVDGRRCNKLNEVLNLLCMRNGKLMVPTHCDATSADSMQYWYASKTN